MVHVVGNSKMMLDQIGDSGIRPSIARISTNRGAAEKNAAELLPIDNG
jgi:hypothetical protein